MFSVKSVKIFWIFLVVLVAATNAAEQSDGVGETRIVNGEQITIDKAPYIVSLARMDKMEHICGGTLITSQFVVTAAHCFIEFEKDDFIVVGGANTLKEQGERSLIDKLFIHPKFNDFYGYYDIAILKLTKPLPLGNTIQTMQLCRLPLHAKDLIQVSGWGKLKEEDNKASEYLYTTRMPVMPQDECVAKQSYIIKIQDSMLCASGAGGTNTCTGDSGGPGIYDDALCAVVSWGDGCGQNPSVFTRIDAVRDFIEECLLK